MKSFLVNGILACIPFHTWCREPLLPVFSVCGRSKQCFRSYPRNYTSVWLSAPTPNPQDVGTRYQTLIACHGPPPFSLFLLPFLPVWPALRPSAFRSLSRRITERHRLLAPFAPERKPGREALLLREISNIRNSFSSFLFPLWRANISTWRG